MDWEELKNTANNCRKCPLCESRTNVVFGAGNRFSNVLFVGEAPGANEDIQGEPFVGRSGKLLDEMLLEVGLSRNKNIYIANMIKCRPPDNRDPSKEELDACIGYLENQIEILNPKVIVCVGRIAAQHFISPDFKITKEKGEIISKNGRNYMATLHPAAILRNINQKPGTLEDLETLRAFLENN